MNLQVSILEDLGELLVGGLLGQVAHEHRVGLALTLLLRHILGSTTTTIAIAVGVAATGEATARLV